VLGLKVGVLPVLPAVEPDGQSAATLCGTEDKILLVDDFLADGQAMHALIDIVSQAGAEVVGLGVAVEKGQQDGGRQLREEGYHLESIAIIDSMNAETGEINFR